MAFDLKSFVGMVAPGIATAFGGPLAGAAVGALSEKFLSKPDGTEKELSTYFQQNTPADLAELKKLDNEFILGMEKLGVDVYKIDQEDRASARERQVQTGDKTPNNLAYLLTAGFFGVLVMMFFIPIPEENKAVVFTMLGSLGTAWIASMVYFFGSTKGSKDKDETFKQALAK